MKLCVCSKITPVFKENSWGGTTGISGVFKENSWGGTTGISGQFGLKVETLGSMFPDLHSWDPNVGNFDILFESLFSTVIFFD